MDRELRQGNHGDALGRHDAPLEDAQSRTEGGQISRVRERNLALMSADRAPGAGQVIRHREVGRKDQRPRQRGPDSIIARNVGLMPPRFKPLVRQPLVHLCDCLSHIHVAKDTRLPPATPLRRRSSRHCWPEKKRPLACWRRSGRSVVRMALWICKGSVQLRVSGPTCVRGPSRFVCGALLAQPGGTGGAARGRGGVGRRLRAP
jgi:hypothetical protein